MKRFVTFGSIDQFRTIIKNVSHTAMYSGQDENDEAIFDRNAKMPVITAVGSEKIHGTNASVCFSNTDGFWVQSRKNIITPEKDNAACAFQAYAREEQWMNIIKVLATENDIDLDKYIISVYFEWSGGNIQKKSALTGVDKLAMIFRYFKVSPIEPQTSNSGEEIGAKWCETKVTNHMSHYGSENGIWLDFKDNGIYNIMNYPTVEVEIDFNEPLMSQNKMIEMVDVLEKDSLVGKAFGIDNNIGEGYVFSFEYKGNVQRFKVKGEEHAKGSGRVKTLKPVDEELENRKITFVNDVACISWRLEQGWSETFGIENEKLEPSVKATGDYLRWIINDVVKEETQTMIDLGLEPKSINGMISKVARTYFMSRLDEEAGL